MLLYKHANQYGAGAEDRPWNVYGEGLCIRPVYGQRGMRCQAVKVLQHTDCSYAGAQRLYTQASTALQLTSSKLCRVKPLLRLTRSWEAPSALLIYLLRKAFTRGVRSASITGGLRPGEQLSCHIALICMDDQA